MRCGRNSNQLCHDWMDDSSIPAKMCGVNCSLSSIAVVLVQMMENVQRKHSNDRQQYWEANELVWASVTSVCFHIPTAVLVV